MSALDRLAAELGAAPAEEPSRLSDAEDKGRIPAVVGALPGDRVAAIRERARAAGIELEGLGS